MQSASLPHTILYFLLTLAVLVTFHEFGHYYACRKLGVKVLRFSLGLGKPFWRYRRSVDDTEFTLAPIPLGGYVKMLDEREGEVPPEDLPLAFNRQTVLTRSLIVFAGPFANFLLAVLLLWLVFMIGETGLRPVLGAIPPGSIAESAGLVEGDEIVSIDGKSTPIWSVAINTLLEQVIVKEAVDVGVKLADGRLVVKTLSIPTELSQTPEVLYERLGFHRWMPPLPPVAGRIMPDSPAAKSGLQAGDRLLKLDGESVQTWQQFVQQIRAHPGDQIQVDLERGGMPSSLLLKVGEKNTPEGRIGFVGVEGAPYPPEVLDGLQAEYRLAMVPALLEAVYRTYDYSGLSLKMIGRMIVRKASVDNLGGPISIAQYAGQSAAMGMIEFLKFLATLSIGLGVLNLLPIPVLDGGHLLFFLLEAARGKPLPETAQNLFQSIGVFLLVSLIIFSFYIDVMRQHG